MKTIEAWCVSATGDVAKVTGFDKSGCLFEEGGLRRHYCDGSWFMTLGPALTRAIVVVNRRIDGLRSNIVECEDLLAQLWAWKETARE